MSEPAYKRRLREHRRRIITTLESEGYKVRTFASGPFHLEACKGKTARAIRISFVHCDEEPKRLSCEPVAARCIRELWRVGQDGRVTEIVRVHHLSD